jgi:hypothetical protein
VVVLATCSCCDVRLVHVCVRRSFPTKSWLAKATTPHRKTARREWRSHAGYDSTTTTTATATTTTTRPCQHLLEQIRLHGSKILPDSQTLRLALQRAIVPALVPPSPLTAHTLLPVHPPKSLICVEQPSPPPHASAQAARQLPTMSVTHCRFYEEKYPEVDSFVMVNVKQVRFSPLPVVVLHTCHLHIWLPDCRDGRLR